MSLHLWCLYIFGKMPRIPKDEPDVFLMFPGINYLSLLKVCTLHALPSSFRFLISSTLIITYYFPLWQAMSPALNYFSNLKRLNTVHLNAQQEDQYPKTCNNIVSKRDVYYNPRLDPKRYLDGPLSTNPATRLRQMLARPGIVVIILLNISSSGKNLRLRPAITTAP